MYRFILPVMLLCAGSAALSSDHGAAARTAAKNAAELDKALAGLTPGKPQLCIDSHDQYATQRIGDTILYKVSRRKIFRADTNGGCFGLNRGDAIISQQYGSQLCAGDPIRTVDLASRIPSGVCTIRAFVPYTAPR